MTITEVRPVRPATTGRHALPDPPHDLIEDRFRLDEIVGCGRHAVVWRAVDERLRRVVAVKVFRARTATQRFDVYAGLEAMARLSHRNLVRMFDGGHLAGSAYLVLELLDGTPLATVLTDAVLTPRDIAEVGVAMADALAHVHERHIIHGDVRPANILLSRSGSNLVPAAAKLADVRMVDGADSPWASPEQRDGGPVGAPTDIFALGLVLTRARVGRQLPTAWTALLTAMCDADPACRPSAREVARGLESWAA